MQGGNFLKYKNRKRNRLPEYDYTQAGCYFVTICTQGRVEYFGKIKNEEMVLNEYGRIVERQWLWLEKQFHQVCLDQYVVMPNHFHGILIIDNENITSGRDRSRPVPTIGMNVVNPDWSRPVPTNKIYSLSELIGAFKTTSSKLIHQAGYPDFAWQRSFYDHIIRSGRSLDKTRQYIYYNPAKWELDNNSPENLYM